MFLPLIWNYQLQDPEDRGSWERRSEADLGKKGMKGVVLMFVFLFLMTQIYFNWQ